MQEKIDHTKLISNTETVSAVREHILSMCTGKPAGTMVRIPPERDLANLFRVSRSVIRQALQHLQDQQLITREIGRGTYAKATSSTTLSSANAAEATVILNLPSTQNRQFSLLSDGFQEAMKSEGFAVQIQSNLGDSAQQAEHILKAAASGAAGVCIGGLRTALGNHHVLPLQRLGIPVSLCCLQTGPHVRAPRVAVDKREAGQVMGRYLQSMGHTRLVAILAMETESDHVVLDGLQAAYESSECPLQGLELLTPEYFGLQKTWNYEKGVFRELISRHITNLLNSPDAPTAIACMTDVLAEETYFALSSRGVQVPADISLISYGVHPRNEGVNRYITAVAYNPVERGRIAAQYLLRMMREEIPIQSTDLVILESVVHEGETVINLNALVKNQSIQWLCSE